MESQIEALHLEHTGVAMLPRQVNFWAANFNMKLKGLDDFVLMVKKLAIYRNHKLTLYRQVRSGTAEITEREVTAFLAWLEEQPNLVVAADVEKYLVANDFAALTKKKEEEADRRPPPPPPQAHPIEVDLEMGLAIDETFVSDFERVFSRPMYVHEYFKYRMCNNSTAEVDFDRMFQDQKTKFYRLSEMVATYLDRALGEYEYVKKYMMDADDDPRFFELFLESILNSREYERSMKAKLSDIHQALYDAPIAADELPFLFRKVRALQLGLDGDYLNQHVVCFKAERDVIIDRVIKIYNTVLSRDPDVHEINANVLLYREDGGDVHENTDDLLSKKLIGSYEFHEILKGALRKRHLDLYQTPILPSILYPALESLLLHISNMTPQDIVPRVDAVLNKTC